MASLIAYCGLDCSGCPAYIATQADDDAAKETIAAQWRLEFSAPEIGIADVTCDGCTSTSGRLGGYCGMCEIRKSAIEHGVENCAHCAEYNQCASLNGFFKNAPQAKATLDAIRLNLN